MTKSELKLLTTSVFVSTVPIIALATLFVKFNQTTAIGLIQTCGQILNDITQHIHLNLQTLPALGIKSIITVSFILFVIQTIKFGRYFFKNRLREEELTKISNLLPAYDNTIIGNIPLKIINSNKKIAYATGWIKPHIAISSSMKISLSPKQLEAVILHEAYHSTHFHAPLVVISKFMKSLLFFFPLVGFMLDRLKLEFELAADAFVIQTQRTNKHLRYALTNNIDSDIAIAAGINTHPLALRINSIVSDRKSSIGISKDKIISSMIVLAIGLALFLYQPHSTSASTFEESSVCVESQCLTNCDDLDEPGSHRSTVYSSQIPASFSLSFSY